MGHASCTEAALMRLAGQRLGRRGLALGDSGSRHPQRSLFRPARVTGSSYTSQWRVWGWQEPKLRGKLKTLLDLGHVSHRSPSPSPGGAVMRTSPGSWAATELSFQALKPSS